VVRDGETLSRLGKMAELFDDHSPLRLMASGRFDKQGFTLVGRLQYRYGEGTWSEWIALQDDGSFAWLSEDNGAYVYSQASNLKRETPSPDKLRLNMQTAVNGEPFTVTSNQNVALMAAQGELPHLPALGASFAMVELRSDRGHVLSIDYGPTLLGQPAAISLGRTVQLDELKMSGLADESVKTEAGRQFNCPACGATVQVRFENSKSVTCGSCHSVIDLAQGIGGELRHAVQDEPVQPLIPLGAAGVLQGLSWQVVGFQHRMGHAPGDDEHFGWGEYLLYNQKRGFLFLVDALDGWSLVKPLTGAPKVSRDQQVADYLGTSYRLKDTYEAETYYVLGEFYWQVQRGQITHNQDYAAGKSVLNREAARQEVNWSLGSQIDSRTVAQAFKMNDQHDEAFKRSPSAFTANTHLSAVQLVSILGAVLLFLAVMTRCSTNCDPNYENCSSSGSGYRSSGGSWGGGSSGGGHK
jgi:hypothetical protein